MSKLKELQRRSTIAWSVSSGRPDLLAAGTMAGTVGLDFDTSAQLEVFSLDLDNSSPNLTLVGKTTSSNMFHKIVWGQSANGKYGILAGGMDNGTITIWDPAKISADGSSEGIIGNAQKHKGPVQALDFNPFQQNLLASGATDSEIFIWDLGKPADPTVYTPGAKPQQASDIASVAWNKKVQHILASTQFSGLTVIWDLKAKKPVINFADRNSKARSKSIAWHPAEATQILTASEEDEAPVLQLWDLRNVFTPVRTYNGHTRGVWGVSWSPFDSSLVLSCGKDNRTLCWHVETAEVLCEVESSADPNVWNFDVQWSPRIPAILSTSSLEGKVNIYALQDVCERTVVASNDTTFGGAQVQAPTTRAAPKHTPGWLQRPCGVAFGFGGKLVSFERNKDPKAPRTFNISQVVTEKDILQRSEKLEEVINSGQFTTFCDEKIESAATEEEKSTWSFLRVLFDSEARHKILNYLGFDEAKTQEEIRDFIASLPADKLSALQQEQEEPRTPSPPPKSPSPPPAEETPTETAAPSEEAEKESKDVSGLFGAGGGDEFSSFSFEQQQQDHERHDHSHTHEHKAASHVHEEPVKPKKPTYNGPPIEIPTSEAGPESAITKALLIGNFEAAVQCCLRLDRVADALIIAASGGPELWARTQEAYFARQTHSYARVMSAVVRNDLRELVEHSVLRDWKATLATLCTYTKSTEFPQLCSALGDRLDQANDAKAAILCYICAGSIDKTVGIWVRSSSTQKNPCLVLQDLVEKISIFRQAVGDRDDLNDLLASKYSEYAEILVSQGRVQSALRYLSFLNDPKYSTTSGAVLLDRVYHSSSPKGLQEPLFPFKRVQVYSQGQPVPTQAPAQQQAPTGHAFTPVAPSHTTPPYGAPPTNTSFSTPTSYNPPATYTSPSSTYGSRLPAATHGTHSSSTTTYAPTGSVPPPPTVFTPTAPVSQPPPTTFATPTQNIGQPPITTFVPTPPITTFTPTPSGPAPPVSTPPVSTPPLSRSTTTPPPATAPPVTAPSNPATPPLPPVSAGNKPTAAPAPAPTGDAAFVVASLQTHIDAANAAAARNPALKAKSDDMTKRLRQLTERLNSNSVNGASVDSLTKLTAALNAQDTQGAQAVLVQLTTGTNDVGASSIIGLKHLIALAKS